MWAGGRSCHRAPMDTTTATQQPLTTPSTRRSGRRKAVLTGLALALGLSLAHPAGAAEQRSQSLKATRLCDPTGCLYAWGVVDSDNDVVSNADEIMAGTDPYKADSRPTLTQLAELLEARQLPSFEAGLAVFELVPAEILARRGEKEDPM